ncbi:MAG TPA: helix-turn-helix transcriptional regulator [Candidatus Paceibacterota bacterium]
MNPKLKWIDSRDALKGELKDPKFKQAYDALEVEFQIIHDVLKKRIEKDMSQEDLARKMGSDQSIISKLESGNYNPSIKFLKRIAKAVGGQLKVTII